MNRFSRLVREEKGDSLAEFGIAAVVMLMAILGVMDCSRALFVFHFASFAAEQGTRYAIVRGSRYSGTACTTTSTYSCDATSSEIQSYVQSLAPPGVTASSVTATTTWPGTEPNGTTGSCSTTASVDGCLIKVQVSVPFQFVLSFLPKTSMTFTSTAEAVTQQ